MDENIDVYIGFEPMVKDKANVVGRFLASSPRECFASPKYLKTHGEPASPKELKQHRCIIWSDRIHWEFDGKPYRANDYLSANSLETMIALAVKGIGIINVPSYAADEAVQKGQLIKVLSNHQPHSCKIYAYYPKLAFLPKKVKLFLKSIAEHAS